MSWRNIFSKTKKILFISSPLFIKGKESSSHDYFTYIISELVQGFKDKNRDIDFVLKVPKANNDFHKQQVDFIDDALKKDFEYDCIIVSPYNRNLLLKEFYRWKKPLNSNKLFFIDQGFPVKEVGDIDGIHRPPYAQANWIQGGECAGVSMANYFLQIAKVKNENKLYPNILIVKGTVGSKERIEGFKNGLLSLNNDKFHISPTYPTDDINGLYDKTITKSKFKEILDAYLKENKAINGIFCCNDEMALGVREVLESSKTKIENTFSNNPTLPVLPIIIGFDGIKDVISLIEEPNPDIFLYDTVLVDAEKQIESVLKMVETRVLKNKELAMENRYVDVDCITYRDKYL